MRGLDNYIANQYERFHDLEAPEELEYCEYCGHEVMSDDCDFCKDIPSE